MTPRSRRVGRIRRQETFTELRRRGRRVRRGGLTVTFVVGGADEPPKVAYAVGRRVGNAVVRNRVRRRLRAAVDDLASEMRPGAYLVSAAPEAAATPFRELRAALWQALQTLKES